MAFLRILVLPVMLILGLAMPTSPLGGETLTWDDLQGAVIEARIVRDQVVLRDGRKIPVRFQNDMEIVIGPGDAIRVTTTPTSHGPRGKRQGESRVSSHTLERPKETKSLGGGHGVWVFTDDTLTYLRTYKGGAFKRTIAFARGMGAPICTANEKFAREDGVGSIVLDSPVGSGEVSIVSAKQISSDCRITKKGQLSLPSSAQD